MIPVDRTQPWQQTNWDWRAAMNFILGGAGSGLLIIAAAAPQAVYRWLALSAVCAVAAGLGFVWLEIGRPWRALHVFLHARTSWMTRESLVAPFVLVLGIAAAWTLAPVPKILAALMAAAFLYCQGRMLAASKGIPAWRQPVVVPLIVFTGFVEALAIVVLAGAPAFALAAALAVRSALWHLCRRALVRGGVPQKALDALRRYFWRLEIAGTIVPFFLLFTPLATVGALLAIGGGWAFKFILVTRLGINQGFALTGFPNLGRGAMPMPIKPGWPPASNARSCRSRS